MSCHESTQQPAPSIKSTKQQAAKSSKQPRAASSHEQRERDDGKAREPYLAALLGEGCSCCMSAPEEEPWPKRRKLAEEPQIWRRRA
jgi:hypothetical protein